MKPGMKSLLLELVQQQTLIFKLFGDKRVPRPRPPISAAKLKKLRAWWLTKGGEIPPSYAEFLLICDGIEDFSASYPLFGACDLLARGHARAEREILAQGIGLSTESIDQVVLLGWSQETTSRVIVDMRHKQLKPGEAVVFDGDPGNLSRHESFGEFILIQAKANAMTIAEIRSVPKFLGAP